MKTLALIIAFVLVGCSKVPQPTPGEGVGAQINGTAEVDEVKTSLVTNKLPFNLRSVCVKGTLYLVYGESIEPHLDSTTGFPTSCK